MKTLSLTKKIDDDLYEIEKKLYEINFFKLRKEIDRFYTIGCSEEEIKEKILSIKDFKNKDNLDIYYYACGMINASKKYYRLFSTDLILLGSLSSNDSDGIGQLFKYLPPTTSNMPPTTSSIEHNGGNKNEQDTLSGVTYPNDTVLVTGMDDRRDKKGLFYSIGCTSYSIIKQGTLNAQRICELGTELDMSKYEFSNNGSFVLNNADGYITKTEIYNNYIRSQFASMNYNPLNATLFDIITGQKKYTTKR
jgi:hypothetical protein